MKKEKYKEETNIICFIKLGDKGTTFFGGVCITSERYQHNSLHKTLPSDGKPISSINKMIGYLV